MSNEQIKSYRDYISSLNEEGKSWRSGESYRSSYGTYITCFIEALNCLDAIASISAVVDPNSNVVRNYKTNKRSIATSVDKTKEGLDSCWEKIKSIAGAGPSSGSGLASVMKDVLTKDSKIKKYKEERQELDKNKGSESYEADLEKLNKEYQESMNIGNIYRFNKLSKSLGFYTEAINVLEKGAKAEIKYVEDKGDPKFADDFFEDLSDNISRIVLAKGDVDKKKLESIEEISDLDLILEDLGGFLNTGRPFLRGIGQGIKDTFSGGPKDKAADASSDKQSLIQIADNMKSSLISLASTIQNVMDFKRSTTSRDNIVFQNAADLTVEEAGSSASSMISFIKNSFAYVNKVRDLVSDGSTTYKSISNQLNEIGSKIQKIREKGGELEKWKDEVMGASRERIAASSYLEKGRSLMQMGAKEAGEAEREASADKKIKGREADTIFKNIFDVIRGKKGLDDDQKTSLIKKKSTFNRNTPDKESVKGFQERLIGIGYLPDGGPSGEFDEDTKEASGKAMAYISRLSGRPYGDSEPDFEAFQNDLMTYTNQKGNIKKTLGF